MKTILGIDLGISSVGWALVEEHNDRSQNKIIDAGVRIFTKAEHPKDGSSLALPRREARGARRTIGRKRKRMYRLKKLLMKNLSLKKEDFFEQNDEGCETIYKEKNKIDVWQLRAEALTRKLTEKEFARILTHIAKRRGYKSNAKSETDNDKGKVLEAITQNQKEMDEKKYLTVGQFFYHKMLEQSQKNSQQKIIERAKIRNAKDDYKQCVTRKMLEDEVKVIFEKQKEFGLVVENNFLKQYLEIAFYQKPLKSVESMIGNCTLETSEIRAAKQSYSGESFVALTKLINLATLINKETGKEEKFLEKYNFETVEKILHETKNIKYSTLRKKLDIPENYQFKNLNYIFNVEKQTKLSTYEKIVEKETWLTEEQKSKISWIPEKNNPDKKRQKNKRLNTYADLKRRLTLTMDFKFPNLKYPQSKEEVIKKVEDREIIELKGYHTIKNKINNDELFQKIFLDHDLFNQIGTILATEKDTNITAEKLAEALKQNQQNTFPENEKQKIIDSLKNISFDKVLHLSIKAIDKLIPLMKQGKRYDEACLEVYGHHSQLERGEKKKLLRILNEQENYQLTNPVVKRCFAQFRKVLNAIIKKYGQFDSMHIELSRELKNSKRKRDEIKKGQDEFKDHKNSLAKQFQENFDREPSAKELIKIRFYEEQGGKCIYSGKDIDYRQLINESKYCEVDHILPYSRSFDNSLNNKVLSLASENQGKGNKTPFEWLVNKNEQSQDWLNFQNRVNSFVNVKGMKKRNLFNTTLTIRHGNELTEEETEKEDGFITRNLIDTQFLGKFTKNFVENNLLFKENNSIKQKVKVRNGALTSHLRHLWGLEQKDRDNHLHHAEDAIIIAFSTQSEVQRLSTYSAKFENYKFANKEEKEKMRQLKSERPFIKEQFEEVIKNIFVSFAPRRKVTGSAHKETLYSGRGKKKHQTIKKDDKGKVSISEMTGSTKLYPQQLNQKKSLAEKGGMPRIDIFQHKENKKYYIVPIYVADFVKKELPNLAIVQGNKPDGTKKPWLEMNEEYQFVASFYKADLIKIYFKKEQSIFGYYDSAGSATGTISVKRISGEKEKLKDKNGEFKKDKDGNIVIDDGYLGKSIGIQNAINIEKYHISPLGQLTQVGLPEKRVGTQKQLRKQKKVKIKNKK